MYFNRNTQKRVKVGDEKVAMIAIYKAELINGKWDNVSMLPFSSDYYSVQHPFLTKDGKKLYFASDMPGSNGGSFDIYVVDINNDGTYSPPRNLGDVVNTNKKEQFPFLTEDGTLYFASDGHQGNGNLDIFMSLKLNDTEYDKPLNLGSTINSEMDDFNFILDEKKEKGYLASNRTGDDNLYTFNREDNKLQYIIVEGELRDKKSAQLLAGGTVKLFDETGNFIKEVVVGKDGTFTFNANPSRKYKLMAFSDMYIPDEVTFDTSKRGKVYIDLQLKLVSHYDAEEIINKKDDGTVLIELENIYFDFDKWNIKTQAESVLQVLIGILKKYPYMEIEIGSHTDSRASADYNLSLSNKRAAATLEYLVKNGIDRKRLKSIGYGETKLFIDCPKNECTEQEHAKNRRATFIILK
jgi:outer membrane protein OmpA-like peptidoglycan-associated protein